MDQTTHEHRDGEVKVIRIPSFDEHLSIYTEPARWLTYSANVAAAVWELHSRAPLDLVDFPEWGGEGYIHLLNRTKWNHIPTVIHLHGPLVMLAHTIGWPELDSEFYRWGKTMEETCVRLADNVFSSSRCSADWCIRHYGLDRERVPILHTGVDIRLFRPLDVPKESRPTLIFVGKIVRNKGVDLLLEASCRLAETYPDLQLRMLGRGHGELMEIMRRRVLAANLQQLLDLPGFVERRALPEHLSRAHVFVAPSLYEGGPGFVCLEAMACGLPVITCEGSGAAEVVIPEENGLLVPPGDLDALVEAIHRLLAHPAQRMEMGQRARRYVTLNTNSQICLRTLENFYRSVVGCSSAH
jgi:glycosyltransferase involved in cell wall biosynthesis